MRESLSCPRLESKEEAEIPLVGHASQRDFWRLAVVYGLTADQARGSQVLDMSSVGQAMAQEEVMSGTALHRRIS